MQWFPSPTMTDALRIESARPGSSRLTPVTGAPSVQQLETEVIPMELSSMLVKKMTNE